MNKDEIIKMMRMAGMERTKYAPSFHRLCEIAIASEREKVAKWMIQHSYATGHGDTTEDLLKELEWQIKEKRGSNV